MAKTWKLLLTVVGVFALSLGLLGGTATAAEAKPSAKAPKLSLSWQAAPTGAEGAPQPTYLVKGKASNLYKSDTVLLEQEVDGVWTTVEAGAKKACEKAKNVKAKNGKKPARTCTVKVRHKTIEGTFRLVVQRGAVDHVSRAVTVGTPLR